MTVTARIVFLFWQLFVDLNQGLEAIHSCVLLLVNNKPPILPQQSKTQRELSVNLKQKLETQETEPEVQTTSKRRRNNINTRSHLYRPQRSWGKVIFSQVSVTLSTGGACMVAGSVCVVAGGCTWLPGVCLVARGACMVAGGCA